MQSKEYYFPQIKVNDFVPRWKSGLCIFFLIIGFTIRSGIAATLPVQGVDENNTEVRKWVDEHFARSAVPPFSFVYGGKNSASFIRN